MIRSGSTEDHNIIGRRRLNAGLLGCGLAGLTGALPFSAQAQSQSQAQSQAPQTGTVSGSSPEPALPDEVSLRSNLFTRISIRTRINGAGPYGFVIDTGATRTAVSEELARELNLPTGPDVLVHGITSTERIRSVQVERLETGGRSFSDLEPCIFPRETLAADGLLGLDVLSRFHLQIDLARRRVMLNPSGPDQVTMGRLVPTRLGEMDISRIRKGRFGQLILLNVRVEGVQADCFVDSGAQYSIGNRALHRVIGSYPGRLTAFNPIRVFGVTGQAIEAVPETVFQVQINSQKLGPTRLLFADLHAFGTLGLNDRPTLLLGTDILSRFSRVSLDFGRSRVRFSGLRRPILQTP